MKPNTSFLHKAFMFSVSSFALAELISLIFFIFVKADSAFNMKIDPGITLSRFLIILMFAFVINLANLVFKLPRLKYVLKVILHSIIICLSFLLALRLMNGGASLSSGSLFVLVFLFFALYFIIFAICALIKKRINKKAPKEKTVYTKQF